VRLRDSYNIEFCHNSIYIDGGKGADAFRVEGAFSAMNDFVSLNNTIAQLHADTVNYLIKLPSDTSVFPYIRSDYNNLYTAGAKFTSQNSSFSQYTQATALDSHSVSVNPLYTGITDLYPLSPVLDGAATPVSYITSDIDGKVRDSIFPDIGAYEILNVLTVDLGGDTIVCDSIILHANNPGSTYIWSTGDTVASITAYSTGTYWVEVTNSFGSDTDSVNIQFNYQDPVSITPSDDSVCPGSAVTLIAQGAYSNVFNWNGLAGTDSVQLVYPGSTTIYSGYFTDSTGCITYAEMETFIYTPLQAAFQLPDTGTCYNMFNPQPIILTGGMPSGGVYSGSGISGNQLDPTLYNFQYALIGYTYTDSNQCTTVAYDSLYLEICESIGENAVPAAGLITSDQSVFCWKGQYIQGEPLGWIIYSIAGEKIMEEINHAPVLSFSDKKLQQGIYIVVIQYMDKLYWNKLFLNQHR
jgi:hypothetical protein